MDIKQIAVEKLADKLPEYNEKKDEYKLRQFLYYHVIKKKKPVKVLEVQTNKDADLKIRFD
jgi:uncharacterized surface protein with fasciclin (FAS1) repeats